MHLQRISYKILVACIYFCASELHGACTSPSGAAGAREWFSTDNAYRLCNGTSWEVIRTTTTIGACSRAGDINFNSTQKAYTICDSSNYKQVDCVSPASATVTAKGTATSAVNSLGWTPLSNVTLAEGQTLFVCFTARSRSPGSVSWNGLPLTLETFKRTCWNWKYFDVSNCEYIPNGHVSFGS
jgi:hypothetical protein